MNKLIIAGGVVLVILGVIASSSLFIVEQTQQAIVLFFGKPQKTIQDPGLYFKIPFGEEVVYYDKRVLDLDPPKERMILADQKRLDTIVTIALALGFLAALSKFVLMFLSGDIKYGTQIKIFLGLSFVINLLNILLIIFSKKEEEIMQV